MSGWRRLIGWVDAWTTGQGARTGDEAEAFVHGRALERLQARSGWAPPWAWLNTVAHGTVEDIAELAALAPSAAGSSTDWSEARARLAGALVERTDGDAALLRYLQFEILIPLEARFLNLADLTPAGLVQITLQELKLAEA